MTSEEDLDQPATKRFVRDAINSAIADAVAPLATKDALLATNDALLATNADLRATQVDLRAMRVEMELGFARLMEAILEVQRGMRVEMQRVVHDEIRTAVGITEEEWQRRVAVLDEKYKDLPPRVTAVEDELHAHEQDFRLHKRPRVP